MERYLLRKCEVFGRDFELQEFVDWFRELPDKEKEEYLLKVWRQYGVNSEQFCFVLQGFILWVFCRYGIYWDEDVYQSAVLSVLDKLQYWDEKKGKFLSFIYSLVRDKVSQKLYQDAKDERHLAVDSIDSAICTGVSNSEREVVSYLSAGRDGVYRVLEKVFVETILRKYVGAVRREVLYVVFYGLDSVYRRLVLWRANEVV